MVRTRRRIEPQAGYNLVFLIVFFGLLSVAATATLPAIGKQIQREKEAELIFRGLQYAEAIRVFQQRFGRYPNTPEELLEVEPRSIRQLWKDPMTNDGRWAFILVSGGSDDQATDQQGRDLAQASAPSDSFQRSQFDSQSNPQAPAGPIIGVVSRKKGAGIRTFRGKYRYQDWRFTADILPVPRIVPGTDLIQSGSVANLGKPFPRGLDPSGPALEASDDLGGRAPVDSFSDTGDDG